MFKLHMSTEKTAFVFTWFCAQQLLSNCQVTGLANHTLVLFELFGPRTDQDSDE